MGNDCILCLTLYALLLPSYPPSYPDGHQPVPSLYLLHPPCVPPWPACHLHYHTCTQGCWSQSPPSALGNRCCRQIRPWQSADHMFEWVMVPLPFPHSGGQWRSLYPTEIRNLTSWTVIKLIRERAEREDVFRSTVRLCFSDTAGRSTTNSLSVPLKMITKMIPQWGCLVHTLVTKTTWWVKITSVILLLPCGCRVVQHQTSAEQQASSGNILHRTVNIQTHYRSHVLWNVAFSIAINPHSKRPFMVTMSYQVWILLCSLDDDDDDDDELSYW